LKPVNSNIWEIAEAYVAGTLPEAEKNAVDAQIGADAAFAAEFHESVNLIKSLEGSGKQKRFRTMLRDVHTKQTVSPRRISLPAHFWRTAAVAAGVAILTSLTTYSLLNPSLKKNDSQYNIIRREVDNIKASQNQLKNSQTQLERDIKSINTPTATVRYTATGFALTNDGYFVTAYHVIHDDKGDCDSVYIQNRNGQYYKAFMVSGDPDADIAVLKVEKKNFRFGKGELPYTFAAAKAGIASQIYTLGYPKDQLVYDEGYISSQNGFQNNDLQYTLELPAGHGQSGSPVMDNRGNVIGILTAVGSRGEANTYAVSSTALLNLLEDGTNANIRLPKHNKLSGTNRQAQASKMEAYTFSVKVYKK
jgi:S1-C subfamily serine protease